MKEVKKGGVFAWTSTHPYHKGLDAYVDTEIREPTLIHTRSMTKQLLYTPTLLRNDTISDDPLPKSKISASTVGDNDTVHVEQSRTEGSADAATTADLSTSDHSLKPRKYQDELFNQCKHGNVIAVAPTGAGKTYIALLMMKHVLESDPNKKVVFVVHKIPLVIQQAKALQELLPHPFNQKVGMFYSDRSMNGWDYLLNMYDVMVCTVQLLLNALENSRSCLSSIQLLVIDECHHAKANHPYRTLMKKYYFPAKRAGKPVPRILGLSASPAAHNTTAETLLAILQLCHDLDCKIRKVEKNEDELNEVISLPHLDQREISMDRYSAQFKREISAAMCKIKTMMIASLDRTDISQEELDVDDSNFSSETLADWVDKLLRVKSKDRPSEDDLESFFIQTSNTSATTSINRAELLGRVLSGLNECLIVNDDRSCYNAWQHLLRFQQQLQRSNNQFLLDALRAAGIYENSFNAQDLPHDCQKRYALLEILTEKKETPDFRALVFVKTRAGAAELKSFLEKRNQGFIKVDMLLGHGTVKRVQGMTAYKQRQILEEFKQGKINVLIATSVAEEGVDVPSCKLVIRMDGIDTALQLIQSRGRARSKHSEFICVFHKESRDVNKLRRCLVQEQKMSRAISMLMYTERFHEDVYMHKVHMVNESDDHVMTLSHIWEAIWYYQDKIDFQDELISKVYERYRDNLQNTLTTSIMKSVGVVPDIGAEKDEWGKFLGYVSFSLPNIYPSTLNPYQAATRMIIYADVPSNKAQEARASGIEKTVQMLKDKDLVIFPSNSWTEVYREKVEQNNVAVDFDVTTVIKKSKKKSQSMRVTTSNKENLNEENAITLLQHHCVATMKKPPVYKDIFGEEKKYYCLCVLSDGSCSIKGDGHMKKKDAKKSAALKMCDFLIKRDGFILVPGSFALS